MSKSPQFFKHHQPDAAPEEAHPLGGLIRECVDCLDPANPAWGDGEAVFCRECAPDHLKNPARHLASQEKTDAA
jgi:hypothetical protein